MEFVSVYGGVVLDSVFVALAVDWTREKKKHMLINA